MREGNQFVRAGAEAMLAYRAALERASEATEVPITDFANTLMFVDINALRKDPSLIPDIVMQRFNCWRFKVRRDIDSAELATMTYVEPWFRKQVIDNG